MSVYRDDEYKRIIDAWIKSMAKQEGKTFKEVAISVLGQERWDELEKEQEEWNEENLLFKVCHPNGSEWTCNEIEQWVLNKEHTQLIYCDMDGFYIDESGSLLIADECGHFEFVGPPEFILKFNRKPLEKELKRLDEEEIEE